MEKLLYKNDFDFGIEILSTFFTHNLKFVGLRLTIFQYKNILGEVGTKHKSL